MQRRKKRKTVDVVGVKGARARGLTYREIADIFGISESAAYYACHKRSRAVSVPAGKQRSIYLTDEDVDSIDRWAEELRVSRSEMVGRLVQSERQFRSSQRTLADIPIEPEIPVVEEAE